MKMKQDAEDYGSTSL